MKYRELGRTGFKVSAIGLGCEGFLNKKPEAVAGEMDFAFNNGINFIDIYASNPELRSNIGAALKGRRKEFFIQGHVCSVWENGQYLRTRDLQKSVMAFADLLDRLKTDYIDIGMIHYVDEEEDFRRVFDGDILPWVAELKQKGAVRSIGLSSHNPTVAELAAKSGAIDVIMFSVNPCYDMHPPEENVEALMDSADYKDGMSNMAPERKALYELCEEKGIGLDAMKIYGGGTLLRAETSPFGAALTPIQCIEYALARPAVSSVMVGAGSIEEIREAVGWCNAEAKERDYSNVLSNLKAFSWQGQCMYCGHCAPCSSHIDIAAVNKFYDLAKGDGPIPETVLAHYGDLSRHASDCIGCGSCERNCPFGVEIIKQMGKTAALFGY